MSMDSGYWLAMREPNEPIRLTHWKAVSRHAPGTAFSCAPKTLFS